MKLVTIRHFKYLKVAPNSPAGALTPEGREQARKTGAFLRWLFAPIDPSRIAVVHAPAERCKESAGIIGEELSVSATEEACLNWGPRIGDSNNDAVREMLRTYEAKGFSILIVISHDGMVNRVAEWTISSRGMLTERISLSTGEGVFIEEDGAFYVFSV